MSRQHYVRVGAVGQVGRFTAVDAVNYPRGSRVIVRTGRGLEIGEVLSPAEPTPNRIGGDGSILRGMTVEDQLLEARLEKNRQAALAACVSKLSDSGIAATLVDVEHLFDGRTLFFYFLGEVPPAVENITAELAAAYDSAAQFRQFADTLTHGCGPDCGTEAASGKGCQTCGTGCAVAAACGK